MSGSSMALHGLRWSFEGQRAGKKGSAWAAWQDIIRWGEVAAGGGLRRDFAARRLQWARPTDTTLPRGTAAQGLARRGPTVVFVTLYALTAQPLGLAWQTGQHQGSQGHGARPDQAKWARRSEWAF